MNDQFDKISTSLLKSAIPPRVLLSKFRFIDDSSKYSRECSDPYYLPFYYFLGKYVPCESLIEIGFGLGLNAGCYLIGSRKTKRYLSVQEPVEGYYSNRIGIGNVKRVYRGKMKIHSGKMHDEGFTNVMTSKKWDLAIISEKREYDTHMFYLDTMWDNVKQDGLIFMDYVNSRDQSSRAYKDFCLIKRREPYIFKTRYGVGAIRV